MCGIVFEKAKGRGAAVFTEPSEGFFEKILCEISQNSKENICAGISFLVFSCEFCEICKNTFFAEQHRTTAPDYSSINSREGSIDKL